jgi:hypothetical protein
MFMVRKTCKDESLFKNAGFFKINLNIKWENSIFLLLAPFCSVLLVALHCVYVPYVSVSH